MNLYNLIDEIASLRAENDRCRSIVDALPVLAEAQAEQFMRMDSQIRTLQAQIVGHCERIAAQSDALGKAAEKVEARVRDLQEENAHLRIENKALEFTEDLAAWQSGVISEMMMASMHGLAIIDLREMLHQVKELVRSRWQAWREKNPPKLPGKAGEK